MTLDSIKNYIKQNKYRLVKFLTAGSSAALINLGSLYVFVQHWDFNTFFLENVANAASMELSILYNFLLSRHWTWDDAIKKSGVSLIKQLVSFHAVVASTALLRIVLFPVLQILGVYYLLNAAIGIGVAASINYFLYDKWIFKTRVNYKHE